MLSDKERGTIIFALEEYSKSLHNNEIRNSVLEIIWKLDRYEYAYEREGK